MYCEAFQAENVEIGKLREQCRKLRKERDAARKNAEFFNRIACLIYRDAVQELGESHFRPLFESPEENNQNEPTYEQMTMTIDELNKIINPELRSMNP